MLDAPQLQQYMAGGSQSGPGSGSADVHVRRLIAGMSDPRLSQIQTIATRVVEDAGADRQVYCVLFCLTVCALCQSCVCCEASAYVCASCTTQPSSSQLIVAAEGVTHSANCQMRQTLPS